MKKPPESVQRLVKIGISEGDAIALRRIAMTLQRWHELECGTDYGRNDGFTYAVERNGNEPDSKPYMRRMGATRQGYVDVTWPIPDRETGARKRLVKIMSRYPGLDSYIQGDPRGAPLYILRPGDIPEGESVDSHYSRGVAVYK